MTFYRIMLYGLTVILGLALITALTPTWDYLMETVESIAGVTGLEAAILSLVPLVLLVMGFIIIPLVRMFRGGGQ